MTDLDDDDLFAIRPTPKRVRTPKAAPPPPPPAPPRVPAFVGPLWPVASYGCHCGFREEVVEPCPPRLDCGGCHELDGLRKTPPRYLPPIGAGRQLTAIERRGIALDAVGSAPEPRE